MLDPKKIERFARYLHESIPKFIHDFKYDLDIKIKNVLQKQINSMNFVNREEFDIQTKILFKTQKKIKEIESKIEKFESIYELNSWDTDTTKNKNQYKNK